MAHAKLIIQPTPNELANVMCVDKNNEASKEGEETAFTRAGAVCRGKLSLRESIKTLTLCRYNGVDLVECEQRENPKGACLCLLVQQNLIVGPRNHPASPASPASKLLSISSKSSTRRTKQ